MRESQVGSDRPCYRPAPRAIRPAPPPERGRGGAGGAGGEQIAALDAYGRPRPISPRAGVRDLPTHKSGSGVERLRGGEG